MEAVPYNSLSHREREKNEEPMIIKRESGSCTVQFPLLREREKNEEPMIIKRESGSSTVQFPLPQGEG
ncbi:hypothetical protein C3711_09300 [Lelliottia aquatilis]|nr:hypothetical protein C3711_09300 [Lelliottia aquatilis]